MRMKTLMSAHCNRFLQVIMSSSTNHLRLLSNHTKANFDSWIFRCRPLFAPLSPVFLLLLYLPQLLLPLPLKYRIINPAVQNPP